MSSILELVISQLSNSLADRCMNFSILNRHITARQINLSF